MSYRREAATSYRREAATSFRREIGNAPPSPAGRAVMPMHGRVAGGTATGNPGVVWCDPVRALPRLRDKGTVSAMARESTGLLCGIPYLAVGSGPPLIAAQGLTAKHEIPSGRMERRMAMSSALPWSEDFRVYVVNRKQGLRLGESMSDIAGYLAAAIEDEFGEPVFLTGTSTGGSVALPLAADRPELVRALVVVASAHRLGPRGRQMQQDLARLIRDGDPAGGWAQMVTAMLPAPVRNPVYPLARVMMRSMTTDDPTDMLVTLDAEDALDVGDQRHRITAPTLVIGGAKDDFYSRELFEQTAAGVKDGRAHIYPNWGHLRTSTSSTTSHLTLGFLLAAKGSRWTPPCCLRRPHSSPRTGRRPTAADALHLDSMCSRRCGPHPALAKSGQAGRQCPYEVGGQPRDHHRTSRDARLPRRLARLRLAARGLSVVGRRWCRRRRQATIEGGSLMADEAQTDVPGDVPTESGRPDMSWGPLYRAGGFAALLFVLLVLVPVVLIFVAPVPPAEGRALLEYVAAHKAVYLTQLVCFVGLGVPALVVFSAVAVALKDVNKSMAAIGGLFGIVSEVIALASGSSPQSLHGGLVVLSNSYLAADTDAERAGLVSAADALIAATNAVGWGGVLTAAAILILSVIMRKGSFGKAVGTLGVVTGAVGIVSEALQPMLGFGYLLYGLLLPTWFALVGWKLLRLDRRRAE